MSHTARTHTRRTDDYDHEYYYYYYYVTSFTFLGSRVDGIIFTTTTTTMIID